LQYCCLAWLRAIADVLGVGHIAIDGKTLCGSAGSKWGPLHLVSAWATEANLTLGQVAVEGKSNEITAIPPLLELVDIHGGLVSIREQFPNLVDDRRFRRRLWLISHHR
jgi:hypothetical protein